MRLSLVMLVTFAGCTPGLPLDADIVVACATDADCPEHLTCVNQQRCIAKDLVDYDGPQPVAPADGASLSGAKAVRFEWSSVSAATGYRVRIATDIAFTTVVVDETVKGTTLDRELSAGTYFWTVSSDITDATVEPALRRFAVLLDAIYVYCGDEDCGVLEGELGSIDAPYRSINRGIAAAVVNNASVVRVATRPNNKPYEEKVRVGNGISLSGGYTRDFSAFASRTAVAVAGEAFAAALIDLQTTVERFAFENTTLGGLVTTGQIVKCTGALAIVDCSFQQSAWGNVLSVEGLVDEDGPHFEHCSISATLSSSEPAEAYLALVSVITSTASFNDGALSINVVAGASTNGFAPTINAFIGQASGLFIVDSNTVMNVDVPVVVVAGIDVIQAGTLVVQGSHFQVASDRDLDTSGARLSGPATIIRDSTFEVGGARASGISFSGLPAYYAGLFIEGSRFVVKGAAPLDPAIGILLTGKDPILQLIDSFVHVTHALTQTAQAVVGNATGVISQSTLVVSGATSNQTGVYFTATDHVTLESTAVVSTGGTGTRIGGYVLASGTLSTFRNNAFVGFPSSCAYSIAGTCTDPTTNSGGRQNNLAVSNPTDALIDLATFTPTSASPLYKRGFADPEWPRDDDLDGRPFQSPPTIGAFEAP